MEQQTQEFKELKEKRLRRQSDRAASFIQLENQFRTSATTTGILTLSHEDLIAKLQSRELKAVQVISAFIWKALEVTRRCNCVTEFHPKMMDWAEELDALTEPKGPLHGLPFCVKDDHDLIDMDTTVGCSAFLEKPARSSAVVVQVLMDAGAIPFCKTNLPQTTYSYGSANPIYGATCNPWDSERSPGGSSSGTACLVASGGAWFGTGTDIGGSVRIPAHFCGTTALLPTAFRNSVRGMKQISDEIGGIHGQIGIIARNAQILTLLYRVLWESNPQTAYDPLVAPLGWNPVIPSKRYTIGYLTSSRLFPALGDTDETILKAKQVLEDHGHILVPFQIPDWNLAIDIYYTLIMGDGFEKGRQVLQHDEIASPAVKFFEDMMAKESLEVKPERRIHVSERAGRTEVNWTYLKMQRSYRNLLMDNMKSKGVEAILMPAFPFPACGIDECEDYLLDVAYTAIWNLVGFPAGVVPFAIESGAKLDDYDDEGESMLMMAKERFKKAPATGLPIGVQIVGKPWNDELVLDLLTQLEPFADLKHFKTNSI